MTALEDARRVADAVLFEGYVLYPYRANDAKNQVRWQFGVLAPPAFVEIDSSERSALQSQVLLEATAGSTVTAHARFLHVQHRRVLDPDHLEVGCLDVGDATYLPWDEAVVREHSAALTVGAGSTSTVMEPIAIDSTHTVETLSEGAGFLDRSSERLHAQLSLTAESLLGPYGVHRLTVRLENHTPWRREAADTNVRARALRRALVSAHLLITAENGAFVSAIDPPEWASGYAAENVQSGAYPVLAGRPGDRTMVLCAPIILYDHPELAPESELEFCDATEMDEMLTLRTLTLTEQEKRQARGSDARAATLVDRVDNIPAELFDRLHGAIRSMTAVARTVTTTPDPPPWWDPAADGAADPDHDTVVVDGVALQRGSGVLLRPASRRADAQDMFLAGRRATVQAVLSDVDGGTHLAVSLDDLDDLGHGQYYQHGRYLYFAPDEVEPIWPAV